MKEKRNTLEEAHSGCEESLAGAQAEHAECGDVIAALEGERDAAVESHAGCEEALAAA